jgi:hypothetical protein
MFFVHYCQSDSVACAVADAIVRNSQAVVAITVTPQGLPRVWYCCVDNQEIIDRTKAAALAAEAKVVLGKAE